MKIPTLWQVKIDDQVFSANSEEIVHKIRKGLILRQDQVKTPNRGWLEIGDVAEFDEIFQEELNKNIPTGMPNICFCYCCPP